MNHAYLIANDGLFFHVIQSWHGESTLVLRIHLEVDVTQMREAFVSGYRIWSYVLPRKFVNFIRLDEAPPFLKHLPVNSRVRYQRPQSLQFPDNEGPVGPWTGIGYIEMVPIGLWRETRARRLGYEIAKSGLAAFEFT